VHVLQGKQYLAGDVGRCPLGQRPHIDQALKEVPTVGILHHEASHTLLLTYNTIDQLAYVLVVQCAKNRSLLLSPFVASHHLHCNNLARGSNFCFVNLCKCSRPAR
jgi:hypothetical protein